MANQAIELPNLANLFDGGQAPTKTEDGKELTWLPHEITDPLEGHTYEVDTEYDGLQTLVNQDGVQQAGHCRPKGDGRYEVYSGHRRRQASINRGDDGMWYNVNDISHEEALLQSHKLNRQREITPKQKSRAIAQQLDIHEGRVGRPAKGDEAGGENSSQKDSDLAAKKVGEDNKMSAPTVYRLARIGRHLGPELMELYDKNLIKQGPAEHLSYLSPEHQYDVFDFINKQQKYPSPADAIELKKLAQDGKLTDKRIVQILSKEKPTERQVKTIKISGDVQKKFPQLKRFDTPAKVDKLIEQALDLYFQMEKDKQKPAGGKAAPEKKEQAAAAPAR